MKLFRFGLSWESVERFAEQAHPAEAKGFPYGVSVFSRSDRADAAQADYDLVVRFFAIHKTGRNPYHVTVELPDPITDDTATTFNELSGRTRQ